MNEIEKIKKIFFNEIQYLIFDELPDENILLQLAKFENRNEVKFNKTKITNYLERIQTNRTNDTIDAKMLSLYYG
jgi:hypothetical protein